MSSGEADSKPVPGAEVDLGMAETVHPEARGDDATALGATDTLASAGKLIEQRPDPDKLVRAVARAKIAGQLFQKKEQVKLGRYHLLEMIGAGGMGVVWGAWDPELDRLVAIKLVKAEMQGIRDRILLEGQALAKVSHPNIVPVFDVGVVDEQVYLVMEWVRGKNLRAYCKSARTVREILAIYRSAGEGLIAAHAAGIIHRDFKPDNAIRGDDGRVRILDFGLARGELRPAGTDARTPSSPGEPKGIVTPSSDLTRGAGTPRYMPPEQAEGKALTPAVDQYAFCVSLREALVERTPGEAKADIPKWIDEILTKGTAREAINRFASMAELLHALDNDPAKIRRRRLFVAGGLAVAGATFAVGMFAGGSDGAVERCAGGKDEIARSWNTSIQGRMQTHLRTLGPYGIAEATRLADMLEDYTNRWAISHRDACLTKERGELTAQLYERNLGCLARTRVAMETSIDVLATSTTDRLSDAVAATANLPRAERCLTETQTSTIEPPPPLIAAQVAALANEIERANVLALSRVDSAIDATASLVVASTALGYLPLIARAQLVRGIALIRRDRPDAAITPLELATRAGFESSDHKTAIEAYAQQIFAVVAVEPNQVPSTATGTAAIAFAESIAKGLGPSGSVTRALLYNNIGTTKLVSGDRAAARAWFQRALSESSTLKGGEAELNVIWSNLALATDDLAERIRLLQREHDELARALGPNHPSVISNQQVLGMLTPNPRQAMDVLDKACREFGQFHPHLHERVTQCSYEIAWLAQEHGDIALATDSLTRVRLEPEADVAEGFTLLLAGKHAEAVTLMRSVGDAMGKRQHIFPQFRAADAYLVMALAQQKLNDTSATRATLERMLALLLKLQPLEQNSFYQRRLARVRTMLATLTRSTDPVRAREHARFAIAWYRVATGYQHVIDELEKI